MTFEPGSYCVYTTDGYTALDGYVCLTGGSDLATVFPLGATLSALIVGNSQSSTRWAQIFDGYTKPANNAKPIVSLQIGANSQVSLEWPINVKHGIEIVSSTTGPYLTYGSTDLFMTAWYYKR